MFYENELRFLCEILKKCRLRVSFTTPDDSIVKILDDNFKIIFIGEEDIKISTKELLGEIKPYTIYKLASPFNLMYVFFLLPQTTTDTVIAIGPFLPNKIEKRQILELSEKQAISPDKQKLLVDYFASLPVLTETDRVFTIIDTFAERIWGGSGSYTLVDSNNTFNISPQILSKVSVDNQDDIIVNMKLMESRYAYENEIMEAVSMGNDHKVAHIISVLSATSFDKRTPDTLRNTKNYCIIMNTLLRKAAEKGGVHPLHLDDMSTSFALKIEQLSSAQSVNNLFAEMTKSYCRLVRKHSTRKYSSTVQKTMALIDYDLSSNLSLSSLAQTQNISSGYLATIFKKETGKTVTEYVIDKRIQQAMRLLSTTKLQIQTVALHCGIMDVQYFSKIFKKKTGMTPRAYRETSNIN